MIPARGVRERLPAKRKSVTFELKLDMKIYVTLGLYDDGRIGELFVSTAKQGSMLRTSLGAWAVAVSKALQFGMPMHEAVSTFREVKCDVGILRCEDVPEIHEKKVSSSWDAIALLLETVSDSEGRFKESALPLSEKE